MKSREYWSKRFELLELSQLNKGAKYYAELEKQYLKACSDVQKEVEAWYARFADENGITLQDASRRLNSKELEEFRWNVQEYIEKGRTLNISDKWKHELENASAKFHVTRLESLKLQMQNHVEVLYGNEADEVTSLMRKMYEDGYYHTAYEIQKGYGIGYSLMKLDTNTIEKVINKPWAADGSNFSSRIWKSKNQLVNELHNGLTQAIIQGKNSYQVTEQIAKRFNVGKAQAGRLVATESAFFSSASRKDCFKELGVEEFQIVATLDNRTSEICQSLDGQHFPMSKYEIGVTAPPFHPNCRTVTIPYFDDEFTIGETRAARDAGGKTYEVPGDMTYKEWKKQYIEKPEKDKHEGILKNIKSEYNTRVNEKAQAKHVRGNDSFDPSRSELTIDPEELIKEHLSNGVPIMSQAGNWTEKMRFTHSTSIGVWRNKMGDSIETNNGIMHFSKKRGIHVVPAQPKGENQ